MRVNRSIYLFLLFVFFASPGFLRAQQTQVYVAPDAQYRSALDLFQKQKYAEAQEAFDKFIAASRDKKDLLVIDAQYYAGICAIELFHKDAEIRLKQFLADHPESPKCRKVKFQLGKYNYRKKKYDDAIAWFRQVEIYDLQADELSEFYFKRGYSHYELGHIDSAKKDFYEIKDIESTYSPAATYYYAHIAYVEGNHETALQGFLKLSGNETFGPVVPWYIAQIYFLQGRYNEVIIYAPPLLDSAKRAYEIAHLIGASYYRTDKYKEAVPFLEQYRRSSRHYTRQDAYELGYAYYKSDNCPAAVPMFQQSIADSSDALAQNSWYHMADCELRMGNKMPARNAFLKASAMKFDPVIREDALFNSARLSYELDFAPFNEAIVSLNEYLREYPNTPRRDEAYTLLTNVYLGSEKYKEALESIEQIRQLSPLMQPTYQKIAYNRGIELYRQKDYDGAMKHFDKALVYPVSRELNSQAHYWKAESLYAKAETKKDSLTYLKAVEEYKAFLFMPGATILPNYNTANYNIAYCYFQVKDWKNSMTWFRKYIANKTAADPGDRIFDAHLRLGDGYFRMNDYLNSAEFYGKAQTIPTKDNYLKDYALFQQAMALGYQGKRQEKADLLKKMRETYPKSRFLVDARLQEARTLHDLGLYDRALEVYSGLYETYPTGPIAILSLENMGLIYRAKGDPDNALVQYKKAVELMGKNKGQDFVDIMHQVKEIHVGKGQLDQWENYAASVGFIESQHVADSTTYVVSRKLYNDGKCTEVIAQTNKYIQKYPDGVYITDIHNMRAECAYKNDDLVTALASYNAILDKGKTKYTDGALAKAALIYYRQNDYTNAARLFTRLERESKNTDVQNNARINLMRSYVFLDNLDSAAVYAAKVITIQRLPGDLAGQANYLLGKSALKRGDKAEAEKRFKETEKLQPKTEYAAEARYQLCWIKFDNKDYKGTEKALLKHINDYAAFSTWSGKGWLLLADNYLALKDTFQAKFVLQSYIENGDVPALQQEAQEKLRAIEAGQRPGMQRKEEELIIPMGEPGDNKLYENEGNKGGGQ